MSLTTPDKIRTLRHKLHVKAKNEPSYRFYLLYDKVYRADILQHAYLLAKANQGASGVDGVTFEDIEKSGRRRHKVKSSGSNLLPSGASLGAWGIVRLRETFVGLRPHSCALR
jgi:hypothetical protein